jgi:hypothetical protein
MVNYERSWLVTGSALLALVGSSACNLESRDVSQLNEPTPVTSQLLPERFEPSSCSRGVAVVLSDYVSSQIALCDPQGNTLNGSFISSGSSRTNGLAFAISGDVVLPSAPSPSGRLVLLDRFGTNVISWFDVERQAPLGQLPVGTGFESNPQDYLEIDERLAFISRWGEDALPGDTELDGGGDVLVIDTRVPAIETRIAMPVADGLPARPGSMLRLGDEVLVSLERVASDYSRTGEAMLVGVDIGSQAVAWVQTLTGLKACGRPTLSPAGDRLALVCTGALDPAGNIEDLGQSVVLILDPATRPPRELVRFPAASIAAEPLQARVTFASDQTILLSTQTPLNAATHNRWLAFDLTTQEVSELSVASPNTDGSGKGIVYGGVACDPGCSDVCLLADKDQGVLQRVQLRADGGFERLAPVEVEDDVGLPPAVLSAF